MHRAGRGSSGPAARTASPIALYSKGQERRQRPGAGRGMSLAFWGGSPGCHVPSLPSGTRAGPHAVPPARARRLGVGAGPKGHSGSPEPAAGDTAPASESGIPSLLRTRGN